MTRFRSEPVRTVGVFPDRTRAEIALDIHGQGPLPEMDLFGEEPLVYRIRKLADGYHVEGWRREDLRELKDDDQAPF